MNSFDNSQPEDVLTTLVHDLRQPLDNIGNSAYFLKLITDRDHTRAHEQFRVIERQVAQATRLLEPGVGELTAPVVVSDEMMPGVVSLPHGWGHDKAGTRMSVAREHAGVNNNLLAPVDNFDPLSNNAAVNGIPVEVVPA
jgi:hypothetical protein